MFTLEASYIYLEWLNPPALNTKKQLMPGLDVFGRVIKIKTKFVAGPSSNCYINTIELNWVDIVANISEHNVSGGK